MKVLNLEFMQYKKTDTFILKKTDDIQAVLDDNLNILIMLKSLPYIKGVQAKATLVEQKMTLIQDTLDG